MRYRRYIAINNGDISLEHLPVKTSTDGKHRMAKADRRRQMPTKMILCSYCGEKILKSGTRKYCNNNLCQKKEKSLRQSLVDGLAKDIKKGLYANYKIFREQLPASGRIELDYDKALKRGFDEHAFYGTSIAKDNTRWYKVGEYYFSIRHNENERIVIIHKN